MSALSAVVPMLRCPRCGEHVEVAGRTVRCGAGHATDIARQGHANFLSRPAGAAADDAAMVAARMDVLGSGVYAPIRDGLVEVVEALALPPGGVVDIGAGTGYYAAAVLESLPDRVGVALDLSVHAARRAARAHPRLGSLVHDARADLPVRSGAAALVLDVFAPRNPPEFARVLAPGGQVVVVTPRPEHLGELVTALGLPRVDARKEERLADQFAAFTPGPRRRVVATLHVSRATAASLARMGPGAHHLSPEVLAEFTAATGEVEVTLAVDIRTYVRP